MFLFIAHLAFVMRTDIFSSTQLHTESQFSQFFLQWKGIFCVRLTIWGWAQLLNDHAIHFFKKRFQATEGFLFFSIFFLSQRNGRQFTCDYCFANEIKQFWRFWWKKNHFILRRQQHIRAKCRQTKMFTVYTVNISFSVQSIYSIRHLNEFCSDCKCVLWRKIGSKLW